MGIFSKEEIQFQESGVLCNIRADGRNCLTYDCDHRWDVLEVDIIPQGNGSSRIVYDSCEVICCVKMELGEPSSDNPEKGRFECSVDVTASGIKSGIYDVTKSDSTAFENFSIELRDLLMGTFSRTLPLSDLCVVPGLQCWILYLDCVVVNHGGNLIDTLMLAARTAILTTKIPMLKVLEVSKGLVDVEIDEQRPPYQFNSDRVPLGITMYQLHTTLSDKHLLPFLVDPSIDEADIASSKFTASFLPNGDLVALQKTGSGSSQWSSLQSNLPSLQKIALRLISKMKEKLSNLKEIKSTTLNTYVVCPS